MKLMKLNIQLFATNGNLGTLSGDWKTTYTVTWSLANQSTENNESYIDLTATFYTGNSTTIASSYSNFKLDGETIYSGAYTKKGAGNIFVKTKRITIKHNDDGSFPGRTVTFSTNDYIMGSQSDSGTISDVPDIPRKANILTAPNFNDEQNPTITYENKAGNSVTTLQACISLTGEKSDIAYRDINKTGTLSYTFNLTDAERKILRQATTTNSRTVYFFIRTVIGGVTYTSKSSAKTFSIINADPDFTNFEFKDINEKTIALTGNNQDVILGYSNVEVTIPVANKAVAKKEATMTKYRFNSLEANYSETQDVTIISNGVTSGDFSVYAIDSRGNSKRKDKSAVNVINYTPLQKGNITIKRENGVSENVVLEFDATIDLVDFGAQTNSITSAQYRYKIASETKWSELENITVQVDNEGKITFNNLIKGDTERLGFNINNAYSIEVYIKDELSEIKYTVNLGSGIPHIAYAKNGISIMGAYDESVGGLFQVGGKKLNIPNVYNTYSDSQTDAYSCEYVNKIIEESKIKLYSTKEQIVGTWFDGRPLYEKTITFISGLSSSSTNAFAHGISNADMVLVENAWLFNTATYISYHLPITLYNSSTAEDKLSIKADRTNITFNVGTGWGEGWKKIIILRYTKTTD